MPRKNESEENVSGVNGASKREYVNKPATTYQVKTTGFTKQYSSYASALKEFNKLQNKFEKAEKAFTITLSSKEKGGQWIELDKASLSKSHYKMLER